MATRRHINRGNADPNAYMNEAMEDPDSLIPIGPHAKVYAYKADLRDMEVEAIAFSVPSDPSQPVGISADMRDFPPVRDPYRNFCRGGALNNCKATWFNTTKWGVIPVNLGISGKSASGKQRAIKNSVTAVLNTAEGHGYRVIAFPAFGTGLGNVNVKDSACAMYDALFDFFKRQRSLEEVHIVHKTGTILSDLQREMNDAYVRKTKWCTLL